jgi:hypothetical protein
MRYSTALLLLLLASPAAAQAYPDVVPRPSDEAIRAAWAAILPDTVEDSGPGVWPRLPKAEPRVKKAEADVCTRHGLRKTIRGKSWRCAR